jgi:hypothetical protein
MSLTFALHIGRQSVRQVKLWSASKAYDTKLSEFKSSTGLNVPVDKKMMEHEAQINDSHGRECLLIQILQDLRTLTQPCRAGGVLLTSGAPTSKFRPFEVECACCR